jgi:cell division transport system ATP-binding protein
MLELRDVTVSYPNPEGGRRVVLQDVNLRLERGEMAYLIGPTGSGKSTLLKLLYMDRVPDSGLVRVGHFESSRISEKEIPLLRRTLGVVFQDFQLLPDRDCFENVAFALYATGKAGRVVRSRVLQVLARVGLSHRTRAMPHQMSGGEQQRACIARAIANEPHLLLADEPTGNLDPAVADEIHQLLLRLNRQGMALLMATHDYRLIRNAPARTFALTGGSLVEVDPLSVRSDQSSAPSAMPRPVG